MLCLFILAFVTCALAASTHPPDVAQRGDLIAAFTVAFNQGDLDHNGQIEVQEFFKVFDSYDANHDNKMTMQEYESATQTDKFIAKEVFKAVDSNHDGFLTRGEVGKVFNMYDTNHNGVIDILEFIEEYTKISNQILANLPPGYTFQQVQPTVPDTTISVQTTT